MDTKIQLKKDILAGGFDWIDDVYVNLIPPEVANKTNKTQLLITDVNSTLTDFGNGTFNAVDKLVQVQIYFSKSTNVNFDEAVKSLLRFFIAKNWRTNGFSNFTDPDTLQNSVTIKINKII